KRIEDEAEDAALQAEVVAVAQAKKAADDIIWKICEQLYEEAKFRPYKFDV
ncbi:hypothetical protein ACJX0J_041497, partial [Zea mays]